jgi:hypothetical protein
MNTINRLQAYSSQRLSSEWLNQLGDVLIFHNRRELGGPFGLHYLPHHPFRLQIQGSLLEVVTDFKLRFPDGIDVHWPRDERPLLNLELTDASLGEEQRFILLLRNDFTSFVPPYQGPEIRVFDLQLRDVSAANNWENIPHAVCLGKVLWNKTTRKWGIDHDFAPVALQAGASLITQELLEWAIKGATTLEQTSLSLLREFDAYNATGGEMIDLVKLARRTLDYITISPVSTVDWNRYTVLTEILGFYRPIARIFAQHLCVDQLACYPGLTLRRFENSQSKRSTESWSDQSFLAKVDALKNSRLSEWHQAETIHALSDFLRDVIFNYQLLGEVAPANEPTINYIKPL